MNIPYLKKGDIIGICAPARKVSEQELQQAIATYENWGLTVRLGKHLFDSCHQFSAPDAARAADVQDFISDTSLRAIMCARGGYGCARLLPYLDFSPLQQNPKWIVGYSDITAFHLALANRHIPSIHGAMPFNFTPDNAESVESLRKVLFGEWTKYEFAPHELNKPGLAQGVLTGGNLSILYSLQGTPYALPPQDIILFIEDIDEYLYHIDRMLMNLTLSGVFNRVKGIIVGGMTDMKDNAIPFGKTAYQIIAEHTAHLNIPVCFGFEAGHQIPNKALLFGKKIELQTSNNNNNSVILL